MGLKHLPQSCSHLCPSFMCDYLLLLLLSFLFLSFPWYSLHAQGTLCTPNIASDPVSAIVRSFSFTALPLSSVVPPSLSLSSTSLPCLLPLSGNHVSSVSYPSTNPSFLPPSFLSLSISSFSRRGLRSQAWGFGLPLSSTFLSPLSPSFTSLLSGTRAHPYCPSGVLTAGHQLPCVLQQDESSSGSLIYSAITTNPVYKAQRHRGLPLPFLWPSFKGRGEEVVGDRMYSTCLNKGICRPVDTSGLHRRRSVRRITTLFFSPENRRIRFLRNKKESERDCLLTSPSDFLPLSSRRQCLRPQVSMAAGGEKSSLLSDFLCRVPEGKPERPMGMNFLGAAHAPNFLSDVASSPRKKKRRRKKGEGHDGADTGERGRGVSETSDWQPDMKEPGDGLREEKGSIASEAEERRKKLMTALAELDEEAKDGDEEWYSKLRDKVLEQASLFNERGATETGMELHQFISPSSRSQAKKQSDIERFDHRTGIRRARVEDERFKNSKADDDTIDELERLTHEEEERERLEELRLSNPDRFFKTAKEKKRGDTVPEMYVQTAELCVKKNCCPGCGAAFQTRNPLGAGYVSPRLCGEEESTDPSDVSSLSAASLCSSASSPGTPFSTTVDLSEPEAAERAFASTGDDMDKVVALASRSDGVDFNTFVQAIAKAGGVSEEEVFEKLRIACDYNGDITTDEDDDEEASGRKVEVGREGEVDDSTLDDIEAGDFEKMERLMTPDGADNLPALTGRQRDIDSDAEHLQEKEENTKDPLMKSAALDGLPRDLGTETELTDLPPLLEVPQDTKDERPEKTAAENKQKQVLCQRCHAIRAGKKIDERLRVKFSGDEKLFHPDRFKQLIASLRTKRCIFLLVLDLTSLELLPALPELVRVNPLYVAVTKCDLLPGSLRRPDAPFDSKAEGFRTRCVTNSGVARNYVYRMISSAYKLKDFSVKNVFMISNKSGAGLTHLINELGKEASRRRRPVYMIGAANAGKSSFLNKILAKAHSHEREEHGKRDGAQADGPGNACAARKPRLKGAKAAAAACPLPGTTLDFIPLSVNKSWKIIDTPGIFLKGNYSTLLTQEELQASLPTAALHLSSASIAEGHGVWLGGLARIELVSSQRCFFSFFVSRSLLLRPFTKSQSAHEERLALQRRRLFPPFSPDRIAALSPLAPIDFEVGGRGWQETAADIVICGLGWISVTGCGPLRIRVNVPEEVSVYQRPPLVPWAIRSCRAISTKALQKNVDRQVSVRKSANNVTRRR
ncbi:nitric-oxide synthase [Cystoisospora suis]|uniref:Nitric-oxide synthase n=1 Tax=Cystoisospora suis TaxID=483139 RepID=A0A2C6L495_9APIC|nr:nitric-oxide synthase [Cystoisospora suis]